MQEAAKKEKERLEKEEVENEKKKRIRTNKIHTESEKKRNILRLRLYEFLKMYEAPCIWEAPAAVTPLGSFPAAFACRPSPCRHDERRNFR